jgi:hypothetical protein
MDAGNPFELTAIKESAGITQQQALGWHAEHGRFDVFPNAPLALSAMLFGKEYTHVVQPYFGVHGRGVYITQRA